MRTISVAADLVGERRLQRRREHQQARGLVGHEQALEEPGVEAVDGADRVDDRVLRRELEHHRDVAELEVGVDQARPGARSCGQEDGEVGRHDRLAGAALGGEDRDDLALLPRLELEAGRRPRRRGHRSGRAEVVGHPPDGAGELAGVDRHGEDVLDAGSQGLLEQDGGELGGDQDGPQLAMSLEHLLRGGQATAGGAGRPENDHHGGAVQHPGQRLDAGHRPSTLAELGREALTGGLVGVDHCDVDAGEDITARPADPEGSEGGGSRGRGWRRLRHLGAVAVGRLHRAALRLTPEVGHASSRPFGP